MRLFSASANGGHHPDPETLIITLTVTLSRGRDRPAWMLYRGVVGLGNILAAVRAHAVRAHERSSPTRTDLREMRKYSTISGLIHVCYMRCYDVI